MTLLIRATNILRGVISLVVSGLERKNPEALLELEKENLRKLIGRFNDGLVSHAALCERMMSQVRKNEREQAELNGKITAHVRAGNREAAGQYALRLKNVERELQENHSQITEAEATYTNLVRAREAAVGEAKARIETVRRSIGDLKIRRATAELQSMASAMIDDLGGAGDTLNRLHEMVEEERDTAAGRSRVATQAVDLQDLEIKESEQKALADQALEEFLVEAGTSISASEVLIPLVLPPTSNDSEPLTITETKTDRN
jgi:phage shock protein A